MPRPSLRDRRYTLRYTAAFSLGILILASLHLAIKDSTARDLIIFFTLAIDFIATVAVFIMWLGCGNEPAAQIHSLTPILAVLAPAVVCLIAALPERERMWGLMALISLTAIAFGLSLWRVSRFESRHAVELEELYEMELVEHAAAKEAEEQRRAERRAAREAEEQQKKEEEERQAELESESAITNLMRVQYQAAHAAVAHEAEAAAQSTMGGSSSSTGPSAYRDRDHDHDGNESDQSEYPSLPPAYPRDEEERLLGKQ